MRSILLSLSIALIAVYSIQALSPVFPTPRTFKTIDEIVRVIPRDVSLRQNGSWNPVSIDLANDSFRQEVLMQPAVIRIRVESLERISSLPGFEDGYRIKLPDSKISRNGSVIPVRMFVYFPADKAKNLTKVAQGSELEISGVVRRADINTTGVPWLNIDVIRARVR